MKFNISFCPDISMTHVINFGKAETSLKIEDLRSNKTTGKLS
jgi:hypothetical protein